MSFELPTQDWIGDAAYKVGVDKAWRDDRHAQLLAAILARGLELARAANLEPP